MSGVVEGLAQLLVPAHVLVLAALGLLLGQHETRTPRACLVTFALGFAAGAGGIALAVREMPSAIALLVLAACAGLLVAISWRLPMILKHALGFATGAALALDSPPHAVSVRLAIVAQIVTGLAAFVALLLVMGGATRAVPAMVRIGLRIAGSWIAATAILVVALRLARG